MAQVGERSGYRVRIRFGSPPYEAVISARLLDAVTSVLFIKRSPGKLLVVGYLVSRACSSSLILYCTTAVRYNVRGHAYIVLGYRLTG